MFVKATRVFASTVYGNVGRGQILEASQAHAEHLIKHGLAEEYIPASKKEEPQKKAAEPAPKNDANPADPTPPTAEPTSGQSSQAGQASQPKTAKKSARGKKKAKKEKSPS